MARDWSRYFAAASSEPHPTVLDALARFGSETGLAVDLGAGAGRDTVALLRAGWRVVAVDSSPDGLERLAAAAAFAADRLETRLAPMEDAVWPQAQLVNASYSLPFCPPERFPALWQRIVESLPTGGRFSGHLFGDRDEWTDVLRFSRAELDELFRAFVLESLAEEDEVGSTATGETKHWHVFHVVARKR
jgi:SAM-dependent methyltransferase